jgi:CRISPR-associated protein Cas2
MKTYLVCFDISDDKIRRQVGNILLHYGHRVQESVFEVLLRNEAQQSSLYRQLQAVAGDEQHIHFYAVCAVCRGQSRRLDDSPLLEWPSLIVV